MDLKQLSEPLPIECIEFRVQSVNTAGYATLLAYKDARVDMTVLDRVVGKCNWKRRHTRDNKNCTVLIYCKEKKEWIDKEDTGTASNAEKEKGLASDSFKRACTNWGIGRELYDYPFMSVKLKSNEFKVENGKARTTWDFKLKEWAWVVAFDDNKQVTMLKAIDQNGDTRFSYDEKGLVQNKPSYPVANYTKGAKALLNKKCTIEQMEQNYHLSKACKQVINELYVKYKLEQEEEKEAQNQDLKQEHGQ